MRSLVGSTVERLWNRSREKSKTMRGAPPSCVECPGLKSGLCGTLSGEELTRLSRAAWCRQFYPGQIIHAEGEKPGYFCAIISGVVKELKSLPNPRFSK
jgi:hypothetical protein